MATNAVSQGVTVQYTATGAVESGDVVILNSTNAQIGIVAADIAASGTGAVNVVDAWEITKATTANVFAVGDKFKMDAVEGGDAELIAATGVPDVAVGNAYVIEASSATDTTIKVRLF